MKDRSSPARSIRSARLLRFLLIQCFFKNGASSPIFELSHVSVISIPCNTDHSHTVHIGERAAEVL